MMKRLLLWGGGIVLLVLVGWGMVKLAGKAPSQTSNGTLSVAVSAADNVEGPASASVTLVEYSDFQCPACKAFEPIVKQLLQEPSLQGKVRFVYRYFPLPTVHQNAELSARAGQAAALQGKFWPMHDILFENQDTWAGMSDAAARTLFAQYAQQIGLDVNRYASDLDSSAVKDRVATSEKSGEDSGVDSTPTFFINGNQMPHPQSYDEFKQYVIDALPAHP